MQKKWALRAATLTMGATAALGLAVGTANAASTIQWGSTGQPVRCVQQAMNYLDSAGLSVDGQFGQNTYNAVVAYQGSKGIQQDGQVGPQTGGDIKADIYNVYLAAHHSGDYSTQSTMSAWMSNCNSQLPG
ncbi:peptidoglycan-binding domain-containing protein [Kitasatospora aureofaciens]|uniref:peptidoglycan-binding domain-containing protein n=1 Tax=Kitasatospora aureofaciens TaxID=1894 RepID=UPI00068A5167|nr:peptidoglycan-binding domain-containing protein [Kitasatospora aureofaciens]